MNIPSRSFAVFGVGLVPAVLLYVFAFQPWGTIEGITFGMIVFAWGLGILCTRTLPGGKHVGAVGYLTFLPVAGFAGVVIPLSLVLAAVNQFVRVAPLLALCLYASLLAGFFLVYAILAAINAHSIRNDAAETKAVRALKDASFELLVLVDRVPDKVRSSLQRLQIVMASAPVDTSRVAVEEDRELAGLVFQMQESVADADALATLISRAEAMIKRRNRAIQNAAR